MIAHIMGNNSMHSIKRIMGRNSTSKIYVHPGWQSVPGGGAAAGPGDREGV